MRRAAPAPHREHAAHSPRAEEGILPRDAGEEDHAKHGGGGVLRNATESCSTLTRNAPESGLKYQVTGIRLGNRRLRLGAARERVGAFDALCQGGGEKAVDIAVEHRRGLAGLNIGAQVFDHLVRLQHIGADLVAPADIGL